MTKAVSICEILFNFYQTTQCNIPEDSHLRVCCCENLKSHKIILQETWFLPSRAEYRLGVSDNRVLRKFTSKKDEVAGGQEYQSFQKLLWVTHRHIHTHRQSDDLISLLSFLKSML
jgi:hypothetical protein